MRVADIVARTLAEHGVRHSFGMPGGEVLTLVDALNLAGVQFVLARHETAAAIMAEGAATLSGAPGVLLTTLGPGLANAVNGIADASQEHLPLIVLCAAVDHGVRSRYTHQILDQAGLLKEIVKGCFEVEPQGAGAVVARAIRLAMTPPMGPVYVAVSPATQRASVEEGDGPCGRAEIFAPAPGPDDPAIRWLSDRIGKSKRPLVIAGWEAIRSGASGALVRLAERAGAPVITTYKAKGAIPERHRLSLGAAGLSPLADGELLPIAKAADLVVLAGYDPIEMRTGWLDPFSPGADVIEITLHPADHGMHQASARVEGSVAAILEALAAALPERSGGWPGDTIQKARASLEAAFQPPAAWGAHAVMAELQPWLDAGATLTVDSGAHRILMSQMLKVERPLGLLQSAGFCTMGAAVPLAVGAKLTEPGRTVIAVLGDGGLEMGLGELATLRDQGAAITIVVLQDESLALIELKQREAKLAEAGVRLGRTPYEKIAEAFGGHGARVTSSSELARALEEAAKAQAFSVIVCEIEARDYVGRI